MPNGKQGDHPFSDIIIHRLEVYSPEIDDLVRRIASLCNEETRRELADRLLSEYNEYSNPDLDKLRLELTELFQRTYDEAERRGYELDDN